MIILYVNNYRLIRFLIATLIEYLNRTSIFFDKVHMSFELYTLFRGRLD